MNKKSKEPKLYSINKPYTVKVLDISTGHISSEDDDILMGDFDPSIPEFPIVYKYEEGYFVYVPQKQLRPLLSFALIVREWRKIGLSLEFCRIMKKAESLGYKYVQFDGDGMQYKDLKWFD
jgi:hypothetical protein